MGVPNYRFVTTGHDCRTSPRYAPVQGPAARMRTAADGDHALLTRAAPPRATWVRRRPRDGPGPSRRPGRRAPRNMAWRARSDRHRTETPGSRARRAASSTRRRARPAVAAPAPGGARRGGAAESARAGAPPSRARAGSDRPPGGRRPDAPASPRHAADRRRPGREVQAVRLADHGVLRDPHTPADLGGGQALRPKRANPGDRFLVPLHREPSWRSR